MDIARLYDRSAGRTKLLAIGLGCCSSPSPRHASGSRASACAHHLHALDREVTEGTAQSSAIEVAKRKATLEGWLRRCCG
jgi:hypothetical protein